jgi:hypothetical protein
LLPNPHSPEEQNTSNHSSFTSLGDQPNKLQEWFLPNTPCVVLCPDSYSGRILDEEEAHTLLSAGAAALSHLKLPWPVYIPVHDALRDAHRGIAFFSTNNTSASGNGGESKNSFKSPDSSSAETYNGAVIRLESDSVHSNRSLPVEFCTLSGQLMMFAARLRWHAPRAASLCSELATLAADALERKSGAGVGGGGGGYYVEDEDQNLAAAAEALALSSSPTKSPVLSLEQQRRRRTTDNTTSNANTITTRAHEEASTEEDHLSVYWEMRRSYHLATSNSTGRPTSGATTTASGWETASSRSATGQRENSDNDDEFELLIDTWDDDAVWRPWAAEDDPIERLEMDALWSLPLTSTTTTQSSAVSSSSLDKSIGHGRYHDIHASLVAAAVAVEQGGASIENSNRPSSPFPSSATSWRLAALRRDYQPDDGRRPLILLQSIDQRRQFLRLQSITELPLQLENTTTNSSSLAASSSSSLFSFQPPTDSLPGATSFSSMLNTLLNHTTYIINATDAGQLASDDWWLQQGNYVPPLVPSYIVQDAVRDIFQAVSMPSTWPGTGTGLLSEQLNTLERFETTVIAPEGEEKNKVKESAVGKSAPLNSLLSRLALHALRLGNPRAIAMLWTKFLRELRFAHWEAHVPLPRMQKLTVEAAAEDTTETYSAMHQNLQFLDLAIRSELSESRKEKLNTEEEELIVKEETENDEGYTSAIEHSSDQATSTTTSTNSTLEGEKALHFLETLPPAAVYAELLDVGFSSAVALLSRAPAAKLPAVAAQIARVIEVGNAWLGEHGVAVVGTGTVESAPAVGVVLPEPAGTTTTGAEGTRTTAIIETSASESNLSEMTATSETEDNQQQEYQQHQNQPGIEEYASTLLISTSPAVHAMIHSGLGIDGMKTLVQILACVEQTIAAGQSLLQRLQNFDTSDNDFSKRAANELIARALEHGSSFYNSNTSGSESERKYEISTMYGTIIDLSAADFASLPLHTATTDPFWSEWCISVLNKDISTPLHRLFVRHLPAELRVATVITSEMS